MNLILPDWIDGAAWDGWVEMRERLERVAKVPLTKRCMVVTLCNLTKAHEQGYDANFMLNEAAEKGWRGVFVTERTPRIAKSAATLFEPLSPRLEAVRDRVEQHERDYWAKKNGVKRTA